MSSAIARQTRSKKAKAATPAVTPSAGPSSSAVSDKAPSASDDIEEDISLNVDIPADINIDALQELIPDADLHAPTPDLIVSLYRAILEQLSSCETLQVDLNEVRADMERKEVELDQALQDRERSGVENSSLLANTQKELETVKKERDELATTKASLTSQLSTIQSSQSSSTAEVATLKHKVADTEREKRDLVNVISRLKEEGTQREEEIQTLRTNLKEARQEHQTLESQLRELRSTDASNSFKVDTLTQQLRLSQAEAQRANTDLDAKLDEFSKFRRAKQTELSELHSKHDSLSQRHDSTQSTLKSLQSSHATQTRELTQALEKVRDLTGKLAEQDATYASEAAGLRKVIFLMEEREQRAKEIVENVENEWATVGEKAQRREDVLREEVERERKAKEQAEARVDQLETVLDRMGRGELPAPAFGRATPDLSMEGMIGLSPTIAMASRAQKGGKTFTEVYADFVKLQDEYAKKSVEYDQMDRTLTMVLAQIEERAPILAEQRFEYERLQSEANQLGAQLSQALADRDTQAHHAKDNADKLMSSIKENDILTKNLDDLGSQIKSLLKEIARRDDPTIPSDNELETLQPIEPAENIDAVITNNLVLFRNIDGLQEQNKQLLKIVRELGEKMEAEEQEYRETLEAEQTEAVREAHEAMQELAAQLERQKQSSETTIKAYVAERDALKLRLARAEKGLGTSNALTMTTTNGISMATSGDDLARELAEVQNQFDTYKEEMGVDSVRLREELVGAQRDAGQLGAALAKANAKIDYLSDRHRMSQEQFDLKKAEVAQLTQRNEQLFMQYTRVEVECNRALDDLQVSTSKFEQLRNECANLRAEKQIWESSQTRLMEENRTLAMERSHLSDLMGNVQKMHNDLELSGQNERRRLESQLQMLENQTQDLRTQLTQERDTLRHVTLQKDIELKDIQSRLDKAAQEFSQTREALVGAETSKKHLEERVNELTRQLQGNEEKLSVYERRTSTLPTSSSSGGVGGSSVGEQQLKAEVAELRSTLKVSEMDLAAARRHVQQFQEISKANEEALASLHTTHDEYKSVTEAQITLHESDLQALEDKLQAAQGEITALNNKYNELQKTFDSERNAWLSDKKVLEDTIVDMSASERNSESERNSHENEVRLQEERAKAAEERYSREVIAHADSIKTIEDIKQQLATSQKRSRELQTQAETASAKLTSSEASWKSQKEALEKDATELTARCQDLTNQNNILHQHLESISSQAARIRQAADADVSPDGSANESQDSGSDAQLSELRSVVAYLRKEKEIVDLQLELSKQECVRYKTQVDHLSQKLDESRKALAEERERAVEVATSDQQHAELVERINQLNILRESNTTLRADCEAQSKRARELDIKLRTVSAELEPVKEQARLAKAEVQARIEQISRLEDENKRWQERNTQLLSKYDRIDPVEMQALRSQIEQLQTQVIELQAANAEKQQQLAEQISKNEAAEASAKSKFDRNMTEAKRRIASGNELSRNQKTQIEELGAQVLELTKERDALLQIKATLDAGSETQRSAEASQAPSTGQTAVIAELQAERDQLIQERDKLLEERIKLTEERSKLMEERPAPAPTGEHNAEWEAEKAALIKAKEDAISESQKAAEGVKKALEEQRGMKTSNAKLQQRIQELTKARNADSERAAQQQTEAVAAALEKAKADQAVSASNAATSEDLLKKHAEELRALEERLTAQHQAELEAAKASSAQAGIPIDQEAVITAAVEAKLKERHEEEITKAIDSGRNELAAKLKLKDAQVIRIQARLKELEAQKLEWDKSKAANVGAPPTPTATTSSSPTVTPSTSAQSVNGSSTATAPTKTPSLTNLPPRPTPATRGARGGPAGRGGATRGRGGVPAAVAAAANSATGGISIAGAAGKRPRESDNGPSTDDSLAKRLKPAESAKPPIAIRRPPAS